jgi:hypothetical protein
MFPILILQSILTSVLYSGLSLFFFVHDVLIKKRLVTQKNQTQHNTNLICGITICALDMRYVCSTTDEVYLHDISIRLLREVPTLQVENNGDVPTYQLGNNGKYSHINWRITGKYRHINRRLTGKYRHIKLRITENYRRIKRRIRGKYRHINWRITGRYPIILPVKSEIL